MISNPWNSLEIVKLFTGLLTPILIAIFGVYLHRITKRFEHIQWHSQKLIEKRLAVYDSLAPKLNDLFCYFTYVGNWRDTSPLSIIKLKRTIDKEIYLAAPLFSKEFFYVLMEFQDICFRTFNRWGQDACLRTDFARRKQYHPQWEEIWESSFSDDISSIHDIRIAYIRAMHVFSKDIGVQEQFQNLDDH